MGWTFNDSNGLLISTSPLSIIHADDPQFGLIFIRQPSTTPLNPTGSPFSVFHQAGGVDPFVTQNGTPIIVPVGAPVPEASTTAPLGLRLLLGLGGLAVGARKKSASAS